MQPDPDLQDRPLAPKPRARLGAGEARRLALGALGFREPRPAAPGARQVNGILARLGLVQIDSVNVLARAHYMPLFSRLGPYDPALLDYAAYRGRDRRVFEYWAHEASLVRVDLQPALRWRMADARAGIGLYGGLRTFEAERRPFIDAVLAAVAARGPLSARDLEDGGRASGAWWGWSDGKRALEWLFWAGLVTTATRRGFERLYDLPERVLPRAVLDAPTPSRVDAQATLMRVAARALGVATERDLRDYFRLDPSDGRVALARLVDAGEVMPVSVEGWRDTGFILPGAVVPRKIEARAIVSPFDPLVWRRERTERVFGFRYRIEIYTPAHKREHGYYVLPFLFGDRLAARLDLKADRAAGRLVVQAFHVEPGQDGAELRDAIAAELLAVAAWLRLGAVGPLP